MALDRFKMTAPLLGDLSRRVAAAFFAKTLGTLLHNGVPMVTSLRVVIHSVANRYLAKSLTGVLADVEKGQQLSVLLKKVGMFPELFLQMMAIGEETGHLAEMLLSASLSLENDARTAVQPDHGPAGAGADPGHRPDGGLYHRVPDAAHTEPLRSSVLMAEN